jgi:hypothetical protein
MDNLATAGTTEDRAAAGRAVASINRELGLLRRAFTLGASNGKVGPANMPNFKGLFQKEKNARQGFWEHSEYEAFRSCATCSTTRC